MFDFLLASIPILSSAPIVFVALQHKRKKLEIEALRDGAEYERGFRDGMEKAAKIAAKLDYASEVKKVIGAFLKRAP